MKVDQTRRTARLAAMSLSLVMAVGIARAADPQFHLELAESKAGAASAPTDRKASPLLTGSYERLQDGVPVDLAQYSGKVVLVVNTASKCGYTGQYEGLEALYSKYKGSGLVVLGFPSSSFRQEYKEDRQIAEFCKNTYGIEFPMFSSVEVVGDGAAPLFKELLQATGQSVRWNFNKYLIGRDGKALGWFGSGAEPLGGELESAVKAALAG